MYDLSTFFDPSSDTVSRCVSCCSGLFWCCSQWLVLVGNSYAINTSPSYVPVTRMTWKSAIFRIDMDKNDQHDDHLKQFVQVFCK